ncbi:hypothetical protein IKE84_01525, partial [Candidatus Saccharibacteria bacterium]|nr:hypothetical protein [Candidatus Saccharibacteria bacterium]
YISSMSCPSGYTCSGFTPGTSATGSYTVTVKNNAKTAGGTVTMARKGRTFTVTLNQQSGSGGTGSVTATYGSGMPGITKPSRTGYTFGGYYTGTGGSGTQYYNANGASVRNWDKTAATTLYAKWTLNNYTVNITSGGTSVSATSLSVPYGGSKTFTVQASNNYWITSLSCPSGYSCTGHSTGTAAVAKYTVTVKNNNKTAGGTITIAQSTCGAPSGGFCDTSGHAWTKIVKTANWNNRGGSCPSGYHVATLADAQRYLGTTKIDTQGTNTTNIARGKSAWGNNVAIWTDTAYDGNNAYHFWSGTSYGWSAKTGVWNIVCTK